MVTALNPLQPLGYQDGERITDPDALRDIWGLPAPPPHDPELEAATTPGGSPTASVSWLCRMTGVCRDADGRIVLDPTAGGTYDPSDPTPYPIQAVEAVAESAVESVSEPLRRIGTVALGAVFLLGGFVMAGGAKGVYVNLAKAGGVKYNPF